MKVVVMVGGRVGWVVLSERTEIVVLDPVVRSRATGGVRVKRVGVEYENLS